MQTTLMCELYLLSKERMNIIWNKEYKSIDKVNASFFLLLYINDFFVIYLWPFNLRSLLDKNIAGKSNI